MEEYTLPWKLVYDRFKPAQEGLREALCTLGNGYLATRGAATESAASRIHYPGTYMAGVYNKLVSEIAGREVINEDMVNCPNWLFLTFRIKDGEWFTPSRNNILFYKQELEMRKGVLTRRMRTVDRKGRKTTIETQRIVHMGDMHRAAIKYVIIPENYDGLITIRSALNGAVRNTGVARYRQLNSKHLKACFNGSFTKNGIYLSVRTKHSGIIISQAARTNIFSEGGGREIKPDIKVITREKKVACQELQIRVEKKQRYEVEKIVAIYTSMDKGVRNNITAAINSARRSPSFSALLKTHRHTWDALWKRFDIQIRGDDFAQQVLRLHTFHLLQTASIHNILIDAGLPARGLHGEAYRGHIFWDEMFAMPFYNIHFPQISRALLRYRYRRLPAARKYARENGYKGSMFPWQSGSTGEEETQTVHQNPISGKWGPDYSCIQRHVSFSIAYNTWQYWKITRDRDFMEKYGAEMILSIARFGSSLVQYDPKDKRYHTEGLMGPDEFHEKLPGADKPGFRDNAYTNLLIAWTLIKAGQIISFFPAVCKGRLFKKLGLESEEIKRWEEISGKMNIIINKDDIISQFDGYLGLKELNWAAYRKKYGNIQRLDRILKAEGKSPNEYKIAKQADVLMIFYLFSEEEVTELFHRLGYHFHKHIFKRNYEYYVQRTSHGSTLSKVVHCYLSLLLGREAEARQRFESVLKSDIYDTQGGTTPEGIHIGVMGGSMNIALKGFAGISIEDNVVRINPRLPRNWNIINFRFHHGLNRFYLAVTEKEIIILATGPKAKEKRVPIIIKGRQYDLVRRKMCRIPY